jgi:hypothetical protein
MILITYITIFRWGYKQIYDNLGPHPVASYQPDCEVILQLWTGHESGPILCRWTNVTTAMG